MSKKKLAGFFACVLLCASLASPVYAFKAIFTDVPADAWSAPFVYDLAERGIVSGYGDGTFGPDNTVQRCEYAKMLVGITKTAINTSLVTPYSDVPNWEWYFPYVNSSLTYIAGYTEDGVLYFRPEEDATREDVAAALIKTLDINLSAYQDPSQFLSERFSDIDSISPHNRIYVAAAVDKGFLTGDSEGTFRGQASITRAEVAAILCRAFPR